MAFCVGEDEAGYRITVRPNCSVSWRGTKRLIVGFAACLAAVSGYFAARGAWLVLPFAGVELAVLAAGFYLSALAGRTREVIEVRGDELRLLRGAGRPREVARLSRHWSRVALVRDPRGWHPSRLVLQCHGRSVEVLTRVVEAEREELAELLSRLLGSSAPLAGCGSSAAAGPRVDSAPVFGRRGGEAQAMSRV